MDGNQLLEACVCCVLPIRVTAIRQSEAKPMARELPMANAGGSVPFFSATGGASTSISSVSREKRSRGVLKKGDGSNSMRGSMEGGSV